ncbi:MAG: hypothetical protein LBQ79_02720 [Deltaproteobacteria bacterium]|nr:hypothetical protein [Deltaproteobacteria bacterium]
MIEVKYCPEDANNDAGCSEKDFAKNVLDIAFDQADQAIREKDYQGHFRLASSDIISIALAVRGRDQVAVRFLDM